MTYSFNCCEKSFEVFEEGLDGLTVVELSAADISTSWVPGEIWSTTLSSVTVVVWFEGW